MANKIKTTVKNISQKHLFKFLPLLPFFSKQILLLLTMRFHFCAIYFLLIWITLQFCAWIERNKKYVKYFNIKNMHFPNQNLDFMGKNFIHEEEGGVKTILLTTPVYGMDHWGIGFGREPFQLQG